MTTPTSLSRRRVLLAGLGVAAVSATPFGSTGAAQSDDAPPALAAGMATAAGRFLDGLPEEARTKATYEFAAEERTRWHWTVPRSVPRNGLPLAEMTPAQRETALALLRASLSEEGYAKNLDIMSLQEDLGQDPSLYYVTIFGDPGGTAPWGWRFEGHHLSRHFTVAGDEVAAAPFFHGAWPTESASGLVAMEREEAAARELVLSLSGAARDEAVFQAESLTVHVTQNEPAVQPLEPVGVLADELAEDQQALIREIVETYLASLPDDLADAARPRAMPDGVAGIRFGWAGSFEPRQPQYYRLQGETFLLEFDNSRNSGTHIHSVWRDFDQDFGRHLLD